MRRLRLLLFGLCCSLLLAACSALVPNSPDELIGRWEGSVLFRSAMTPLVLEVRRDSDSMLVGVLSARELLISEQPVDSLVWDAPRVRFTIPDLGSPMHFTGFARAGRITGRLTSAALPAVDRAEALPKLALRRSPASAPPYALTTARIVVPGATLAATLRMPLDSLSHPGIVFLHGATQPLERDVAALADTFARAGWATLTWDRRGSGGSSGDAASASLDEFAADAAAAARWLAAQPGVDGRVGAWGLSQGGLLAPRVAERAPLAFIIAVSPPDGAGSDSSAAWQRVRVPALLVYGDRDDVVPVEASIRAIMQAAGVGSVNVMLRVFPGAGHELRLRPRGEEPFDWPRAAPGYVDTLLAWSARVVRLASRAAPPDTGMPKLQLRPGWR